MVAVKHKGDLIEVPVEGGLDIWPCFPPLALFDALRCLLAEPYRLRQPTLRERRERQRVAITRSDGGGGGERGRQAEEERSGGKKEA